MKGLIILIALSVCFGCAENKEKPRQIAMVEVEVVKAYPPIQGTWTSSGRKSYTVFKLKDGSLRFAIGEVGNPGDKFRIDSSKLCEL